MTELQIWLNQTLGGPLVFTGLVSIPLPGTGAWTGALVAALMDLRLKSAMPAIFCGVLVASVIVTCIVLGLFSL